MLLCMRLIFSPTFTLVVFFGAGWKNWAKLTENDYEDTVMISDVTLRGQYKTVLMRGQNLNDSAIC